MGDNPFKSDENLRQLLAGVENVNSGQGMSDWKLSFLKAYETYLDPDGVLNARDADGRLQKKLQYLAKVALRVQALTKNGNITQNQVTADGRRALEKWTTEMKEVEAAVAQFCPKTSGDESKVGYDKYELGAILIKDGFQAYEIMLTNRDFATELRDGPLNGVLDKNALSILEHYAEEMQRFVDIMSDLGLLKLMTQCVEIYKEEPRPDPATEPELFQEPEDREVVEVDSSHGKGEDNIKSSVGTATNKINKAAKPDKKAKSRKSNNKQQDKDQDLALPEDEEEEEEEPPPPTDGEAPQDGKIIYFDPTTGSIGLLERGKIIGSDVMFRLDQNGEPENKGVIESQAEKENIVWLLKKLEKKEKPKEGAWLEEIKKAKAAKKAAEAAEGTKKEPHVRMKVEPAPGSPHGHKKKVAKPGEIQEAFPPLESHGAIHKAPKKGGVEDFQGMYQKVAPRPSEEGWNKVHKDEEE